MDKIRKNIIVLEPSKILFEGLSTSIAKEEHDYSFFHIDDISDIALIQLRREVSVVIINPVLIQNRLHDYLALRKQYSEIYWLGIIYSFFENSLLKKFDDTFLITDDISIILRKINKVCNQSKISLKSLKNEELSERESNVLKYLVKGLSNKEIACKLNISIHTVNTHRRNIMDKTGIRSLPGLTIYAISQDIIPLE